MQYWSICNQTRAHTHIHTNAHWKRKSRRDEPLVSKKSKRHIGLHFIPATRCTICSNIGLRAHESIAAFLSSLEDSVPEMAPIGAGQPLPVLLLPNILSLFVLNSL